VLRFFVGQELLTGLSIVQHQVPAL
jgi:hypothetical protein